MDDLRRLDGLDNERSARPPLDPTLPAPDTPGITNIGVSEHGTQVHGPIGANYLVVGTDGSGKTCGIGAMMAGARPAHPTKYLIVSTTGMPFTFVHPIANIDDIAVTYERQREDSAVIGDVIGDTISTRRKILEHHGVNNLDQLRAAGHAAGIADLIVVLDDAKIPSLNDPLGMLRYFGIYLWAFQNNPHANGPYHPSAFDFRIALRTDHVDLQTVLNSPGLNAIPNKRGAGYLQTRWSEKVGRRPMRFRFTEPTTSPHPAVPGRDDPHEAAAQLDILPTSSD